MISFGVFTDAHYARGRTDGTRACGRAIARMEACARVFAERGLPFAVNLGDTLDRGADPDEDLAALAEARDATSAFPGPVFTLLGNHDLETMDKARFRAVVGSGVPGDGSDGAFGSFDRGGVHFVLLDADFREDGTEYDRGGYDWTDSFVPERQRDWLRRDLLRSPHEDVLVLVHQNLDPRLRDGRPDPHVVRNAAEVRSILEASGRKISVIQGHCHEGGLSWWNGIPYGTLRAVCEGTAPDDTAFAVVHAEDGRVRVEGFGRQPDLALRP